MSIVVDFLEKLRPGGPWVPTAIVPDGPATTITVNTAEEADAFVEAHNGKRNLYYSPNPTRTAVNKKAAKTDIARIEYMLADLDPNHGESPEDAKARYLAELNGSFEPKPTALVNSGNGIQGLWRLTNPIPLGEPIMVNGKRVFSSEDQAKIADVEARAAALMVRLGAKPGTQNIDRILRLPGTVNLPNDAKRREGRVACPTELISFNGASYPLDAFPLPEPTGPGTPDDGGHHARQADDELFQTIHGEFPVGERSDRVWWVINEMLRRGYRPEAIIAVLLDQGNKISAHIYDQRSRSPSEYAQRQVEEAVRKITLATDEKGVPYKSPANIRVALLRMGIALRYDRFADRVLLNGLAEFGPALEDAALDRIWLLMEQRFQLRISKDLLRTVVLDAARLNGLTTSTPCDGMAPNASIDG
jgi:hypothetical protein